MGEDRRWSQVNSSGSSPSPRSGAASVIVDAHMYIFGGYGGGGRLDDFHCFDLDNTRWSCVEPSSGLTPGMRENNGLIEFRGKLYLFGGYNGQQWLNDLFSFDLFTKEWHNVDQSGQPPASRFGYVSVVHNNFFVVFGGYDGSTWLNDMHQYDFETWTWCAVQATGQIPSIRSCPSWCKEGDSVFVFGGYDGVQRMNDLFECNLETHTWRQLTCGGAVPSPRYFHACAIYGGRMVTFGGYNGAERLNDMHEYSFATSLWTKLDVSEGDVPSGRSSLISQVYGNSLFIFGGYNGANVLNDFYEFRFEPVVIPPPTLVQNLEVGRARERGRA